MSDQTSAAARVAENIRLRRRLLGLSQAEVGERVGTLLDGKPWSKATWSTVEIAGPGQRNLRRLDPDELQAIATALGTTVAGLFGELSGATVEVAALLRGLARELEDRAD